MNKVVISSLVGPACFSPSFYFLEYLLVLPRMLNDYGDYFKLKWPKYSSIKLYFWSNKTVLLNGLKVTSFKSVFVAEKTWLKYKTNLVKSFKHSLDQSPPHSLILLTACVIGTVRERERGRETCREWHTQGKKRKKVSSHFYVFSIVILDTFYRKSFEIL